MSVPQAEAPLPRAKCLGGTSSGELEVPLTSESRGHWMSFRCTCAVAWCVQDHVRGGLPHADTPLVVFAPPVSTISLAPRTSCWQIAGPSGSLSPHPSKARTLPHSDRVQLPEHGHGRPAPLCLDALVPTTQVHLQPAGLESVPSHPHPLEVLGIDPTPAHHTTRLVLHHSLEGNGT